MAITREKKKAISEKLDNILSEASSLVFVNFHGLSVVDEQNIRNTLRGAGVSYYVVKKTLVRRALQAKGFDGEMPNIEGEFALVSSSRKGEAEAGGLDQIIPAREINNFAKKLKENISIQGGVFEGRYMSAEEMLKIASIPPLQTLYGQIVNLINSPIQGFVVALNEIAKQKEASI